MPEPGQIAAELAQAARGPVTAGYLRALLDYLRQTLDLAESLDSTFPRGIAGDVGRANTVFDAADEAISGLGDEDVIPIDSDAWRQSVGPIMAGACWGAPACSDAVVEAAGGGPVQVGPWGAFPAILVRAWEASWETENSLWRAFTEAVSEQAQAAGKAAQATGAWLADVAKFAAAGYVLYLLTEE